jgi:hypothetical protein
MVVLRCFIASCAMRISFCGELMIMLKRVQGLSLNKPKVSGADRDVITFLYNELDIELAGKVQTADIKRREAYKASMISSTYVAPVTRS